MSIWIEARTTGRQAWSAWVEARPTLPVAKFVWHPSRSLLTRQAMLVHTPSSSRAPSSGSPRSRAYDAVKHAGLAPCENSSGNDADQAAISRRGRPALRLAAWRAVWGALRHTGSGQDAAVSRT